MGQGVMQPQQKLPGKTLENYRQLGFYTYETKLLNEFKLKLLNPHSQVEMLWTQLKQANSKRSISLPLVAYFNPNLFTLDLYMQL